MSRHPARLAPAVAMVATLLVAQSALAEPPDSSGPVSRSTDRFGVSYFDESEGLLALGGPPPEDGCFGIGFDHTADITIVETASGAVKVLAHQANLPVHVYDIALGDPCEIVFGGLTPEPLFVGTISSVGNDNDLDPGLTRTNSFGSSSTGWVQDAEGNTCRFSGHVRLQINRDGEFSVVSEGVTITC